jgi:hypothetical protein
MAQYPNPGFPPGNYQPMPPPRTSGAAIASLILGILGCVPLLTGVLAVILGMIGLGATKKPGVGGRGLAIAGLVLGLLSIVGWTGFGGIMGWEWVASEPSRAAAKAFVTDLSNGDVNSAAAMCVPWISKDSLQKTADKMKPWGLLTKTSFIGINSNNTCVVTGSAMFANSPHTVQLTFVVLPDGSEKVQSWQIN